MNKILKSLLFITDTFSMVEASAASAVGNTLETAPNQYVEAGGIKFSYRTIDARQVDATQSKSKALPLIMLIHFTGTVDYWDPAVVNGLAKDRPVIVFNNRGIGRSSGVPSDNVEEMANDTYAFIQALGHKKVDVLGFSLGGFVAQELTAAHPELVNKLILVGTSNQGGGDSLLKVLGEAFSKKDVADVREYLFFSQSDKGQKAAKEFVRRAGVRADRDPESGKNVADAQAKAIITWANTSNDDKLLKAIQQPVLIVQGSNDTMLGTKNSTKMFETLKDAQLILYPDANHASFYEYHDAFVNSANYFLNH